jgi:hypothetical protein
MTTVEEEVETVWASYSQLTGHRSCPQRWFYAQVMRLEPIPDPNDPKVELYFGNWWHALMAADSLERGRKHGSLKLVPDTLTTCDNGPEFKVKTATVLEVLTTATTWWATLPVETQLEWHNRLGEDMPNRLGNLYDRWVEEWADDREYEQPLAVEMGWGRDLPALDGVDPHVRLVGYVDEVYLDTRRNIVVVRDHKSHKGLGTQSTLDDMMDSQLQLYAWGASPEVTSWGMGRITATAYDRVRTVAPKTPKVTQSGTLSKSITDFDVHTYRQWAAGENGMGVYYPGRRKDNSDGGYYQAEDSVIESLSAPASRSIWFQRTLTPLNMNLIRAHMRSAVDTSLDMALTRKRAVEEGAAARNLTNGCKWCDFASLCRAQMMGGPGGDYPLIDYKLRERS